MPHVDAHQPGTPCWLELSTIDPSGAKTFYQGLFGWSYNEVPMGPDTPPYIITMTQNRDAGAITAMQKEQRERGVPPNWLMYVSVANVDQAVPKITALGGKVMAGPFDVPEAGRMAVAVDPAGGGFALWQAGKQPGARVVNEPSAMCWVELQAKDVRGSEKFYTGLFGWKPEKMSMGGPLEYTVFKTGDTSVAGMVPTFGAEDEDKVPQSWLGYFQVANCDDTTDKAKATGGQVFVSPQNVPGVGRFAVLADPQGASFGILQAETPK